MNRTMAGAQSAKTVPTVQSSPLSKGAATRARIMDLAYERIIDKGFAATSIEELVEAGGLTKSGFFYHFRDKNDLARQLMERFIEDDEQLLDGLEARARSLHEDPLHAFLIFLKLYAEVMEQMLQTRPGCLVASVVSQDSSFDAEVRARSTEIVLGWRRRFSAWLQEIAVQHPPRGGVDLEALADQIVVIAEGAILLSKALRDPGQGSRQILLYRETVRLIFSA
jgi:TetR/AcrR family transcriptional repressor of nem operon